MTRTARTGVFPSWLVLSVGATAQLALESIATVSIPARTLAVCLVLAVLAANAATTRARHSVSDRSRVVHRIRLLGLPLLLAAGLALWLDHALTALRAYSEESMLAAALPPVVMVIGTVLLQMTASRR